GARVGAQPSSCRRDVNRPAKGTPAREPGKGLTPAQPLRARAALVRRVRRAGRFRGLLASARRIRGLLPPALTPEEYRELRRRIGDRKGYAAAYTAWCERGGDKGLFPALWPIIAGRICSPLASSSVAISECPFWQARCTWAAAISSSFLRAAINNG